MKKTYQKQEMITFVQKKNYVIYGYSFIDQHYILCYYDFVLISCVFL